MEPGRFRCNAGRLDDESVKVIMTQANKSGSNKTAPTRRNWLKAAAVMSTAAAISPQLASSLRADEPTPPKTLDTRSRHVLFAFDDESIPWTRGVELKMRRPDKHAANPIIARGAEGQPDAERAQQPAVVIVVARLFRTRERAARTIARRMSRGEVLDWVHRLYGPLDDPPHNYKRVVARVGKLFWPLLLRPDLSLPGLPPPNGAATGRGPR